MYVFCSTFTSSHSTNAYLPHFDAPLSSNKQTKFSHKIQIHNNSLLVVVFLTKTTTINITYLFILSSHCYVSAIHPIFLLYIIIPLFFISRPIITFYFKNHTLFSFHFFSSIIVFHNTCDYTINII
eukprot:UN10806